MLPRRESLIYPRHPIAPGVPPTPVVDDLNSEIFRRAA